MSLDWLNIAWLFGAILSLVALLKLADSRRLQLHSLLDEYVKKQVQWTRRRRNALQIRQKQKQDDEVQPEVHTDQRAA